MKSKYHILATKCFMCYKVLTDPLSIELGIGPICRKLYERDDLQIASSITPEARKDIQRIFESDVSLMNEALHTSSVRSLLKAVIYYASHISGTDKEVTLSGWIAHLFMELGCPSIAERILQRIYKHTIEETTDSTLLYRGSLDVELEQKLKEQFAGYKESKGWILRATKMEFLKFLVERERRDRPIVKLMIIGETIYIQAPFNPILTSIIKRDYEGRWDVNSKTWVVTSKLEAIRSLVSSIYPGHIIEIDTY